MKEESLLLLSDLQKLINQVVLIDYTIIILGGTGMQNIKVSKDCYIPKDNIKLYIAYDSNAVRKDVRIKRKQGLIYDYTNGKKTMSVIYLKNGELVLTPVSVDTLNQRMEKE